MLFKPVLTVLIWRTQWQKGEAQKAMFSCKSSTKLPQKGKFLTVQGEFFCRIIDVVE